MQCAVLTAERPPPPEKRSVPLLLIAVIVVCFLTVIVLVGVLYNVVQKRVSGPTWFPEGFRFSTNHLQPRNNLNRQTPKLVRSLTYSACGKGEPPGRVLLPMYWASRYCLWQCLRVNE